VLEPDDVSRTARLVAACRALDAERPPAGRIIQRPDTFARALAGREAMEHAASMPGLVTGIALRTRWLDEAIDSFAVRHPGAQVVLLGAGLDTRALRLGAAARFFEIDLRPVLHYKSLLLGRPGEGRLLIPIDLREQRFASVLVALRQFELGAPTCVVWEGVSYYLPEAAVMSVLDQVRAVIPENAGLLLFDYVSARWLSAVARADAPLVKQVADWREPMIFGFDDVGERLAAHGLALLEDVATEDLLGRYGLPPAEQRWYAGRMAAARRAGSA
jgi:methyltransferase (TIGR00027 family)